MAPKTPSIGHITFTADDEASFMQELHDMFDSATIPEWTVVNTVSGGSMSFTIESVTYGFQINIRRHTTARIFPVSIDPLGGFLTSGDTTTAPTLSSSAEWSGELSSALEISSTEVNAVVWAVDDAICVMNYVVGNTYFSHMTMAGKLFVPNTVTDEDAYTDGYMIAGNLAYMDNTPLGLFTTSASNFQYTRIAQGTWSLNTVMAHPGSRTWGSALSAAWDFNGGSTIQRPVSVYAQFNETAAGQRTLGVIKYLYHSPITASPKVRLEDAGAVARYMFFYGANSANTQLILWNDTVAPLT
jgi:hypothetical protein